MVYNLLTDLEVKDQHLGDFTAATDFTVSPEAWLDITSYDPQRGRDDKMYAAPSVAPGQPSVRFCGAEIGTILLQDHDPFLDKECLPREELQAGWDAYREKHPDPVRNTKLPRQIESHRYIS